MTNAIIKSYIVGIEKFSSQGSKYLQCDKCGATLGAQDVIKHRTPNQADTPELLRRAKAIGWKQVSAERIGQNRMHPSVDICPKCRS